MKGRIVFAREMDILSTDILLDTFEMDDGMFGDISQAFDEKMEEEIEQIPRAGRIARHQAFKNVRERLLQYWLGQEFFAHAPNVLIAEMVPDKKDGAQVAATGSKKTAKAGDSLLWSRGLKKCAWNFLK